MLREIALNTSLGGSTYTPFPDHHHHYQSKPQPDPRAAKIDYDSTQNPAVQMEAPWSHIPSHSFGSATMGDSSKAFWNNHRTSNDSSSQGRSSQDPSPPSRSPPSMHQELPIGSNGLGASNFTLSQGPWNVWDHQPRIQPSRETQRAAAQRQHELALARAEARLAQEQAAEAEQLRAEAAAQAAAAAPWKGPVNEFLRTDDQLQMMESLRQHRLPVERERLHTMNQHFSGYMAPPVNFAQQARQEPAAQLAHLMQQLNLQPQFCQWPPAPIQQQFVNTNAQQHRTPSGPPPNPVLKEFKDNPTKNMKRWELSDIYEHAAIFSGDQLGSRFIQAKLEAANSDEKEKIFKELIPNALQLMKDVFGNYVIQKFFDYGNQEHKRRLGAAMQGMVLDLSLQSYACRVVQKAFGNVLQEQQAEMVRELSADPIKVMKDQNGNHVMQMAIQVIPHEHLDFVVEALRSQIKVLCRHKNACRVVQRMLERGTDETKADMLQSIHADAEGLMQDQYGNYVIQHIIEFGKPEDRARLIQLVTQNTIKWSKDKFASNVVEKCIQFGEPKEREQIVNQILGSTQDGSETLPILINDPYGNYVLQKLVKVLKQEKQLDFVKLLKPHLDAPGRQQAKNQKGSHALEKLRSEVDTALRE